MLSASSSSLFQWLPNNFRRSKDNQLWKEHTVNHGVVQSCPLTPTPFIIYVKEVTAKCNHIYRDADKSLARPGRKQANVSVRMAWISFGALPCRKINLMTVRVSMLLKSCASLTCFRSCFLPGQAKDLSAPRVHTRTTQNQFVSLRCNRFRL